MQWKPNVTVAAVICDKDRFLLIEEEADNGVVINQPAGHLELHESIIDAVVREVAEETTRDFSPQHLTGIYFYPHPQINDLTYLRFCFSGQCGEPRPDLSLDDGILRTLWMSREQLKDKSLSFRSPLVMKCIDDFISGKRYPLDLLDQSLLKTAPGN